MTRVALVCAAAFAVGVLATNAAGSAEHAEYNAHGKPWPGHIIRLSLSFSDQRAAITQAMAAWNASGADVRFVLAPSSQADVVVRPVPLNHPLADAGWATIGRIDRRTPVNDPFPKVKLDKAGRPIGLDGMPRTFHGAQMFIRHRNDRFGVQRHFGVEQWAQVAAHELGHVLGLDHVTHACSTMLARGFASPPCAKLRFWQRYCGAVLTPDDVAGAVRLYGGQAHAVRPLRACDLTQPPPTPANVRATPDDLGGGFYRVEWSPPSDPKVIGVAIRAGANDVCPTSPGNTTNLEAAAKAGRYDWTPDGPGAWCIALWFVRGNDQPSARPATIHVTVP